MAEKWKCANCGVINSGSVEICSMCKAPKHLIPGMKSINCQNCGKSLSDHSNHCVHCGAINRSSRLNETGPFPKITEPKSIVCIACRGNNTIVFSKTDVDSERLYLIGYGDILPLDSEEGDFFRVFLPIDEKGFVLKTAGMIVEVGLGEIEYPLGFVRLDHGISKANVISLQPNGNKEIIYVLKKEDRLPVVEENIDWFKVQLKSGLRGLVHKSQVMRTISSTSLPESESVGLGEIALGAAAVIGMGIISGIAGDPEEQRIRRAVDSAMRDRGM